MRPARLPGARAALIAARHRATPRAIGVIVLFVTAAAACTTDEPAAGTSPDLAEASSVLARVADAIERDSAEARSRLAALPGRVAVVEEDDRIVVMRPDGEDERVILPVSSPEAVQSRPVWSPDGTRLAWSETTPGGAAYLVTADRDGGRAVVTRAPFAAIHLAWAPTGERIAFTGNDEHGRLQLVAADIGAEAQVLDEGFPLYFDWDEEGRELLVHVANRFVRVPVDGGQRMSIEADGKFRVGTYLGDAIVFAVTDGAGEVLTVAPPDGDGGTGLVRYGAPAAYVVHPAGNRVAMLARATESVATSEDASPPTLEPNELVVIDLGGGETTTVATERALAWFWSPTGDRLLYGTRAEGDGPTRVHWHVWDGEETTSYDTFLPSGTFGPEYLAFFDQVDRAISYWSPDGTAFTYAGEAGGDRGVWVQTIDRSRPVRIAPGEVAIWSPAP